MKIWGAKFGPTDVILASVERKGRWHGYVSPLACLGTGENPVEDGNMGLYPRYVHCNEDDMGKCYIFKC